MIAMMPAKAGEATDVPPNPAKVRFDKLQPPPEGGWRFCTRYTLPVFCAVLLSSIVLCGQVAPRLVTQSINEQKRTVLNGNVHPQAAPQFDRGAAPRSLAMDRMLLVLKRSSEPQAALDQLLVEQLRLGADEAKGAQVRRQRLGDARTCDG